jgi:SprT protein
MAVPDTQQPLDERGRQQVCDATVACLRRAGKIFCHDFEPVSVRFDLRGRAAGMYCVQHGRRSIRYNPWIFARHTADSLDQTIPHEVAHYVTDVLYGLRNIRPHGAEWKAVMHALGAVPRATGRYDLTGIPVRRQRRFGYRCNCSTHELTTCRHNRVQRREAAYVCRYCGAPIVYAG